MTRRESSSPVPGIELEGYSDGLWVPAGNTVRFMLSGRPGRAQVSLSRLIHSDPNPAGPGVREEPVDWGSPKEVDLTRQLVDFGSFIEVPDDDALTPVADFTLGLWIYPTLLNRPWQAVAAKWAPNNLSFAIFWGGHHTLAAAISHDGVTAEWCTGRDYLWPRLWQYVALTFSAVTGELCLSQISPKSDKPALSREVVKPGHVYHGSAPLMFGAALDPSGHGHWAHLNGKIAAPILLASAIGSEGVRELANGHPPDRLAPVLAAWDLSREVSGSRIVDRAAGGHHGRAVNAPGRAVTGPRWAGQLASLYTDNPSVYDAIYFHDDDLADAGWDHTLGIDVPETARGGIYAIRVAQNHDVLTVPFVVRRPQPSAETCVLLPTLSWLAYSSNRGRHSYTNDGIFDGALCLYDVHSDGSMVYYCTQRKPTRSGNPSAGLQWGAHTLTANLYLIDWLEGSGFPYDVAVDENLERQGASLLKAYRCVILGSHPEYWTGRMLDALQAYLEGGGRTLYLGGNGLYWVTSLDAERPFLMEVRKSGDGDFEDWSAPAPGELQHSTSLEVGGLWARRGRPPRSLLGVETSANVFEDAGGRWGFERLAASREPAYRFVFEGVDDPVIGDFGLNLGSAAAYEMDSAQEWYSGPQSKTVVLARATSGRFIPGRRMPVSPVADIALTEWPNGGAVFAAGAVSWTGSLSHEQHTNSVSRVTENVLRRFTNLPKGASILDSA